ncbi:adenylosuccinate lyase [Agromyces sp. MMS17-SY077]|uniref:Adenylosuccinate lyase n=1 Tax=Agromyces seonyuensis TaxID=2662446 RepID=A0A6I4NSR7_9MICO|nr:adenylosuccinate lyase [Agromyces seonyuensis]
MDPGAPTRPAGIDPGAPTRPAGFDPAVLAREAVAGGNPVIPLVGALKAAVPEDGRRWVHRGATSQDVLDSALMVVAARAAGLVLDDLRAVEGALARLAAAHRDTVGAARTLTQHAVPMTMGLRIANRLRGLRRAAARLEDARFALPAQLAGAGGTLASFVELAGPEGAAELPAAFAAELGLAVPDAPWHTTRWPVTELGDALTGVLDALGAIGTDVATLSRTEIGELAEGAGGGSSAMPQKRNPAGSVLLRSAALRAPGLASTLHLAAALAGDERPDGAWHAEWPTLRELLRLALGAAANGRRLAEGLRVDDAAVARNLDATHGAILAERLSLVLGADTAREVLDDLTRRSRGAGGASRDGAGAPTRPTERDLAAVLEARGLDPALADPAGYTGLAGALVDDAVGTAASGILEPEPLEEP